MGKVDFGSIALVGQRLYDNFIRSMASRDNVMNQFLIAIRNLPRICHNYEVMTSLTLLSVEARNYERCSFSLNPKT